MQTPRTEFAQALRAIASERGLEADVILDTIKQAIIAAYKRDAKERGEETEGLEFEVELDPRNGEAKVFCWPGPDPDDPDSEGEKDKKKDCTPPGFGRIAAQTAKQVIHQKIREAEKGAIMDEYSDRVNSLISGMILRFDGSDVRVDLGRTEGLMLASERVPNERLNPNQRLTFLLKEIIETPKGKRIMLSRSDALFVQKLFEREVPEMGSGSVEVKAIAREPGVRTKMAVFSNQSGVDPVGSCVGQKGVRVQAVTNELGGERVDIIPFTDNTADLIKAALSPAEDLSVSLDEETKTARVKAPEDQLSLAIGRDGQNARLAAKLTGWRIKVVSLEDGKEKTEDEIKEDVEGKVKKEEKEKVSKASKAKKEKKAEGSESAEGKKKKSKKSGDKKKKDAKVKKEVENKEAVSVTKDKEESDSKEESEKE